MSRMTKLFVPVIVCLGMLPRAVNGAADYPTRTITMILGYPAGGVTDLLARTLAESAEKHLKQPVVVVNKVGGGTTVAGYAVSSAKPDGYTLGFLNLGAAVPEAYAYFQEAPYSSKDLTPISGIGESVMTWVVKEDAAWNSLKELIDYAKKNPGIKVGTGGKQTRQHMFLDTLNRIEKTGFVGVPFSGDPANLSAILGGHVPVSIMAHSIIRPLVDAKRLKALATVNETRPEFARNIPTVVEVGYDYPVVGISLLGVNGPKGTPSEIVQKLDNLFAIISAEPQYKAKVNALDLLINYKNTATYREALRKSGSSVLKFFEEEGTVKKK